MSDTKFKSPLISPATNPDNYNLDDVEKRLRMIQLQRMEREEAEIVDAANAKRISREAGHESIKMQMANEAAKQRLCSHLKENGYTHLAGQRNHAGVIILVCQSCQKMFRSDAPEGSKEFLPPSLVPTREGSVGGPNNG
jgi:hypothetical protein